MRGIRHPPEVQRPILGPLPLPPSKPTAQPLPSLADRLARSPAKKPPIHPQSLSEELCLEIRQPLISSPGLQVSHGPDLCILGMLRHPPV